MLIRLGSSSNKFHPSKMRIWPFPHVYCKKVTSVPGLPPENLCLMGVRMDVTLPIME